MDYGKLFKRAYEITIKYKYLWLLGFLIAIVSGGSNFSSSYQTGSQDASKLGEFATAYAVALAVIALFVGLIFFVLWILSLIAEGGLAGAVNKIEDNKETSLGDAFSIGAHYFWRVLGLSLLLGLVVFALILLVVVVPTVLLVFVFAGAASQSGSQTAALLVPGIFCLVVGVIFAVLVIVVIATVLGIIHQYALRYIVLQDGRVWASIGQGWRLIRANVATTFIIFLLLMVARLLVGIVVAIPTLIISIPSVIGMIAGAALENFLLIGAAAFGLAIALLVGSFLAGIYQVFHSSTWTLAFRQLTSKQ